MMWEGVGSTNNDQWPLCRLVSGVAKLGYNSRVSAQCGVCTYGTDVRKFVGLVLSTGGLYVAPGALVDESLRYVAAFRRIRAMFQFH